jgi:hypothetical protein
MSLKPSAQTISLPMPENLLDTVRNRAPATKQN